ncbi:UPF0449 protein C19orf25 homolog [Gouania willdenowi]|nr:UPF0449 protein C19orf25 homolog [Gouania willdenowi]XP_028299945.1 UPF0449 protein C19orf25 homolog [Gouania willdenowi]XP_028299946.1 UPF0449 protein C19orf25 homolog [Gouania willdenowi]XP_028299947.1 UPF0449 protein C19orf25 homolog [Gouania willdenowi]
MNLGSKGKKRPVLPSRPEPPSVERILEDMSRAGPEDPVFKVREESGEDCGLSATDERFNQVRHFLLLQQRLQEAGAELHKKRAVLEDAGVQLENDVAKVKGQNLTVQRAATPDL